MKKINLTAEQAEIVKNATPVIQKAGESYKKKLIEAGRIFNKTLQRYVRKLGEAGLSVKQARQVVYRELAHDYMSQQAYSEMMNKAGLRANDKKRSDKGEKKGVTKDQLLSLYASASPEVQDEFFKALEARRA